MTLLERLRAVPRTELAAACGVTAEAVSMWLKRRSVPKKAWSAVSSLTGVSMEQLVRIHDEGPDAFTHSVIVNNDMSLFDSIGDAIAAIAAGEMIIVVDDDDRENEGDLIMAASKVTGEATAFMIRHTSGILCAPFKRERARQLHLDPMVASNDAPLQTAFTISVDYRQGLTTGISAEERAATVRALANGNVGADDFVRPGHVFPLIARDGGVLMRSGHTEAAVDFAELAGEPAVGMIGELVNDDGTVKRLPALLDFAKEHDLKIVSIADLIDYRQKREQLIHRLGEQDITTGWGPARLVTYDTPFDPVQHYAVCFGDLFDDAPVTTRIVREDPLQGLSGVDDTETVVLSHLAKQTPSLLIMLRDPKLPTYDHDDGDTSPDDEGHESARKRQEVWRDVGVGAQILRDLGVSRIRLLASHERTYVGLDGFGIEIVETLPVPA